MQQKFVIDLCFNDITMYRKIVPKINRVSIFSSISRILLVKYCDYVVEGQDSSIIGLSRA